MRLLAACREEDATRSHHLVARGLRGSVYAMRTTLSKAIWSVVVGAIIFGGLGVLGGFKNDGSAITLTERPTLLVEREKKPRVNNFGMPTGNFDEYVKFTNVGRSGITIRNVLINDKEHCAKLGSTNLEPPVTLFEMGGWSSLRFVCAGVMVEAKIETDRGNATYSWR